MRRSIFYFYCRLLGQKAKRLAKMPPIFLTFCMVAYLETQESDQYVLIFLAHLYKNTKQKLLINMTQASPFMFGQISKPSSTYFTVQGNIGCGKSSFLKNIKDRIPELHWIEEPVQQWKSLGQSKANLLERYYTDPKRWGFTFQIYALFTRLQKLQESCNNYPGKIKISQRSILADKFIFSQIMKDLQFMGPSEHEIFKSLYKSIQSLSPINEAKIIYLRCDPQTCYDRIAQRKRPEEQEITLEYLQMLHNKHQSWIATYEPKQVLILDASQDFCSKDERLGEMVHNLVSFVKEMYQ